MLEAGESPTAGRVHYQVRCAGRKNVQALLLDPGQQRIEDVVDLQLVGEPAGPAFVVRIVEGIDVEPDTLCIGLASEIVLGLSGQVEARPGGALDEEIGRGGDFVSW
jgi:hypothetical protein